jgi:hypothetical protein
MKRGPKGSLTPALQKHICESLEKCNTVKTSMQNAGLSERVYFNWVKNNPSFSAAVSRARAKAKMKLVRVIIDQAPDDWRAAAFLLERSWPQEYARTERVEQIGERAEEQNTVGVNIFYDTGGKGMEKLLTFPVHPSMTQSESEVEQANVPAENAEDTGDDKATEGPPEAISEAPPPKVVDQRLTGRLRPEWKTNNRQP